jgi:3-keto-disaccharide hydrolase
MSRILYVFNSSFLKLFIIFSFVSLTVLANVMPALGRVYDDFGNGFYTLSDGETSPDGKWQNIYNGGGNSGVAIDAGKHVFFIYPRASTSPHETSANLVISKEKFSNFSMNVNVKTAEQLRVNSPPNQWEAAWILFRYTDTFHYYWFLLKHEGVELGKKDCNDCTNPVQGQIFLSTTQSPVLKVGDWSNWKITAEGNHIRLSINGSNVIDFVDHNMSDRVTKGAIGLYTEDAYAEFSDINISPRKTT